MKTNRFKISQSLLLSGTRTVPDFQTLLWGLSSRICPALADIYWQVTKVDFLPKSLPDGRHGDKSPPDSFPRSMDK